MERTTRAQLAKDEEFTEFIPDLAAQTRLDAFLGSEFHVNTPPFASSSLKLRVIEERPEEVPKLRLLSGSRPADISYSRGSLGPSMSVQLDP